MQCRHLESYAVSSVLQGVNHSSPHTSETNRRPFDADQDVRALAIPELSISNFCLAQENLMKHAMTVDNLKCDGCGHTITQELSKIDGLEQIIVNPAGKLVSFEADDAGFLLAKERLHQLGYPETGSVHGIDNVISTAKSFASCAIGRLGQ
jgi:copper chaperone